MSLHWNYDGLEWLVLINGIKRQMRCDNDIVMQKKEYTARRVWVEDKNVILVRLMMMIKIERFVVVFLYVYWSGWFSENMFKTRYIIEKRAREKESEWRQKKKKVMWVCTTDALELIVIYIWVISYTFISLKLMTKEKCNVHGYIPCIQWVYKL